MSDGDRNCLNVTYLNRFLRKLVYYFYICMHINYSRFDVLEYRVQVQVFAGNYDMLIQKYLHRVIF